MPTYSVARLAESDLKSIIRFTLKTWGRAQAKCYSQDLRKCFQLLADSPSIGRSCEPIHTGLHRHEHGKHVVFYVPLRGEVLIVRVLHQQMIPTKIHFEQ